MKNIIYKTLFIFVSLAIVIVSCKKDPAETPVTPKGNMDVEFENTVGDSSLILNDQSYINANGDTFTVSVFKYYISNIKLKKADNSEYAVPESYFLIDQADEESMHITLSNIPVGDYISMSFMIGVDSARNVSGAQTGALEQGNGMFWSWTSGYIMLKMEGTSPQSTAVSNGLMFHVGGFSGANSVLRTLSPSFNGDKAMVSANDTPEVHVKVDLLEMFTSPTNISFALMNTVHMPGVNAKTIADNYENMFTVEHIHN